MLRLTTHGTQDSAAPRQGQTQISGRSAAENLETDKYPRTILDKRAKAIQWRRGLSSTNSAIAMYIHRRAENKTLKSTQKLS